MAGELCMGYDILQIVVNFFALQLVKSHKQVAIVLLRPMMGKKFKQKQFNVVNICL